MSDKVYLTQEWLDKLKKELNHLKTVKLKEVEDKLRVAKAEGDLRENAEYAAALEDKALSEGRISQLENKLKDVEIISMEDIDNSSINLGNKVKLKDINTKEETKFTIVGTMEVNPFKNFISNESPLGSILMGKKEGDDVCFKALAGDGEFKYKILEVS